MKVDRAVMKRLEAVEKKLVSKVEKKYVFEDFNGFYFGDCGFGLCQEEFDVWVKRQETCVEVTIMKYTVEGGNFLGKTVSDCLTEPCRDHSLVPQGRN